MWILKKCMMFHVTEWRIIILLNSNIVNFFLKLKSFIAKEIHSNKKFYDTHWHSKHMIIGPISGE